MRLAAAVVISSLLFISTTLASSASKNTSFNRPVNNYLQNETEGLWEETAISEPLLLMNLRHETSFTDKNGSSAVSNFYVRSVDVTDAPLKTDGTIFSNITALGFFEGTISESFLKKINPHWLSFPPTSKAAHHILAVIYSIMTLIGLFGNALVIFIYIRCSSVRTPANNLILNLAISDFVIMLEAPFFIYNSIYYGPATGDLGCKIYGMLGGTGGAGAIMTLCAISIDRYNVIVFPLNPSRSTTNMRSRIMILIVWIYSLTFSIVPFLEIGGVSGYTPEGFLTACSFDYINPSPENFWFILSYAVAAYLVPLVAITYCYVHILHVVLSAKKIQSSKEKNKTELRLALIVMGIVGLWIFAWTPYAVVAMLGIFGHAGSITPLGSMVPGMFAKIASCCDPYLYAVTHPRFRNELDKMFCSSRVDNQTSHSRRQDKMESECETVAMGPDDDDRKKRHLQRAESSYCEESTVSEVVETKH